MQLGTGVTVREHGATDCLQKTSLTLVVPEFVLQYKYG